MKICDWAWHTGVYASRIISSFTFVPLGSSGVSKEAKNLKEIKFLGLGRCFSVRIAESSKTSKIQPKTTILGRFFKVCSNLAEKQRPKPKNSSSLKFFASFDTLLDPRGMKVRNEMIWEANNPVWHGLPKLVNDVIPRTIEQARC